MCDKRCRKCVISSSFPRVDFDETGKCSFCRGEIIATTQESAIRDAKDRFEKIIEKGSKGSEYDAIMCYSGGKDSTYTMMLAVQKYKLRVLAFTLDNGFLSSGAFDNITRTVEALGVDHLTFKPSSKIFNQIIKTAAFSRIFPASSLRRISSGCNACISVVNNTALRMAIEKRARMILAGFTLGQIPANSIIYQNNYDFLIESRARSLKLLQDSIGPDVRRYLSLPESLIADNVSYPDSVNLLCFESISEDEILQKVQEIGWKIPKDVDGCSSNCRLNVFNNLVHKHMYGYSPYELELSHLIRNGLLNRDQALEKLSNQPPEVLRSVMEKLDLSDEQLNHINGHCR